MAKINIKTMTKQDKARYSIQEEVEAKYSVFEKDGEKFFKLIRMVVAIGWRLKNRAKLFNLTRVR